MTLHTAFAPEAATAAAAITPTEVRLAHLTRQEIVLIDLREEAAFAKGHPLFAACLPLSRLELEVYDRIPRRDTPIVLYDNGEGLADLGAARLNTLGYSHVAVLEGDLQGWRRAGLALFLDVNSASKAFGELVEARRGTPNVTAPELKRLIEEKADLVVLDARRFEEFATMSIPTGRSVPGAELVLRAKALAPSPNTVIVVNCAGRTRSLIGAQSLINAGLPNPVRALRNGTIGWTLAGQALDHGGRERFPEVTAEAAAQAARRAREVSYRAGVRHIGPPALAALAQDTARTLYRFDVRTPEEFAAGHIPGFRSAPGGQLVQETDVFAPVRGARIVLADDLGARADMTASWLAQMGWEAYVLDGGFDGALETGAWRPALPPLPDAALIAPEALNARRGELPVIDVGPSPAHRRGHVPGARFAVRSRLRKTLAVLSPDAEVVFTSPDGVLARFAAADARALGQTALALAGGTAAWSAAGLPLEAGLDADTPPDDVYRRPYEGTDNPVEAMEAYLTWEYGLVDQLARDASHGFYVI